MNIFKTHSGIQENGITVKELIDILKTCDPNLPVATEACGHVYASKGDRDSRGGNSS